MKRSQAGRPVEKRARMKRYMGSTGGRTARSGYKGREQESYAMQNFVVWKGKIWAKTGALLFGFHFSPFPSCQITFSVSPLKWKFLTLRSSHSSKGYPSFCLQLTGFSGCLPSTLCKKQWASPLSSMFQKYIHHYVYWTPFHAWNLILFKHTHKDTQTEECCLERHVTRGQESPNIVISPCSEKVASYHRLCEDTPADTTNLLCKEECKIPVLHAIDK